MTPVRQTRRDNCVAACVASILEVPLEQVDRIAPATWYADMLDLLKPLGFTALGVRFDEENDYTRGKPAGYSLGAVSAGSDFPEGWEHCVVCLDGKIVWDPARGERPGTERSKEYVVIYQTDPAVGRLLQSLSRQNRPRDYPAAKSAATPCGGQRLKS
jgi:hypothetical protein